VRLGIAGAMALQDIILDKNDHHTQVTLDQHSGITVFASAGLMRMLIF